MSASSRPSGRAVSPIQLVALFVAFLLIAGTGGILTAGLLLPAVGSVGAVSAASVDLFDELPSELTINEPSEQSVILDAGGNRLATFYAENRIVVGLDAISQHVKDAVVATEDRRFYEHRGVDAEGMVRAAVTNAVSDSVEGASTLTQQYVKNVLIEESRVTGDPELFEQATERTVGRKLREARMAIGLEQVWSKEEILAGYLNIAQFGPSQYGVETAARHYFNKSAAELGIGESALLAGITQSPNNLDPVANPENAFNRRNVVLRLMRDQGYITPEEHDAAVAQPLAEMLNVQNSSNGCAVAGTAAYFCEYVVKEILNNEAYGEDVSARRQLLLRGGLEIHTTLDPAKQQAAFESVTGAVPTNDPSGISMALSSVEPGTGKILAMAQNTNYGQATPEDPRATLVNFNVGTSYGGGLGFQSGSTFKVFTLIEWLRTGHSLMDRVDSDNRHFPREVWNISCAPDKADDWDPKNLEGFGGGRMTVLESTRMSVNTSFVVMASQLDLCAITGVAEAMGVETGTGAPLEPIPSMTLGANTVTPLSMANAYATLAAGGTACDPVAITRMVSREGEEIAVPPSNCQQVLETDIVNGVNHALQTVTQTRGATGAPANLPGRPTAGKTGTANDDKHAWFVGYIPQMSTAVWMGYSAGDRVMGDITINGRYHDRVYGGLIAAPTWKAYMERATEGMPVVPFPEANPRQIAGDRVPDIGGRSLEEARQTLEAAGYTVRIGNPVAATWPSGTAAGTQPAAGSQASRGATVTIYPSSGSAASRQSSPARPATPSPSPSPSPGGAGAGEGSPDDGGEDN
ncbi:penicillin-binding protein [Georgenia faecalis]|uniref:Penicillin-binding protein n=1 Tax=Georgenia faecalis TaxID=2483799 RepID=A0ABV9D4P7_9MICO|nr:transglycosylase domain-containing protein [Georgenia faecalis]